jgi:hypothetical protein
MTLLAIIGAFAAILGLEAIVVIIYKSLKLYPENSVKLYGEISGYIEQSPGKFYPEIKITDGYIEHKFLDKQNVCGHKTCTGKKVKVLFNRENPEKSRVRTGTSSLSAAIASFAFVFGLFLLMIGNEKTRGMVPDWIVDMITGYFPRVEFGADVRGVLLGVIVYINISVFLFKGCLPKKGNIKTKGFITANSVIRKAYAKKPGYYYEYFYSASFVYEGKTYEFTDVTIWFSASAKIGKSVTVSFDPHNPNEALLSTFKRFQFPIVFVSVGIFLAFLAIVAMNQY